MNYLWMMPCIYEEYYRYMQGKQIYIGEKLKREIGKDEWYRILHEFVGCFTISQRKGIAIDSLYLELLELFPWIFSEETVTQIDQLETVFETYRQARKERKYIKITGGRTNENSSDY